MTDAMKSLNALLEKTSDADMRRKRTGFGAERLMVPEVGALTGAGDGKNIPTGWRSALATAIGPDNTEGAGGDPGQRRACVVAGGSLRE